MRAELPPGYEPVTSRLHDPAGRVPRHHAGLERSAEGGASLAIELEQPLEAGRELLLTVEATAAYPEGLTGRALSVPRFAGAPAARFHGHLGFAPDAAFRLASGALEGLVPVPAEELPRVGLEVPGLVLGYRIEDADYAGEVSLLRKDRRISAELLSYLRVEERLLSHDLVFNLDVQGAPLTSLELLLPAGVGRLATITGPDLHEDRELLGTAADGRERWRLSFVQRYLIVLAPEVS